MDTPDLYVAWAVFFAMFFEQAGVPFPSTPALLAGGALAGMGRINVLWIVFLGMMGSLVGDVLWFYIGRYRGAKALRLLCRIAIQPDSCVRRTETMFLKYGARSLLFAKWIPGYTTIAPPLAGLFKTSLADFLLYDSLGAAIYVAPFIGVGYIFAQELDRARVFAKHLGLGFFAGVVLALTAYIIFRLIRRYSLLHKLRMVKITPEELRRKIEAKEPLMIIDLRSAGDLKEGVIPGAVHFLPDEIEKRQAEIPRDRDIILYCDCPNDVTSAAVALKLRQSGIANARPLLGGWEAWQNTPSTASSLLSKPDLSPLNY